MHLQIIQFITLFLLLLVTGVFWGPWLALHRSLYAFNEEEFLKITKVLAANLGRPMQLLMPMCILFMLVSVLLHPHKGSLNFFIILASFCFILLTLVITLMIELPIVNKIRAWTIENIPSDWEAIRDKWVRFHALRVFPALLSFGLYVVAILNIL